MDRIEEAISSFEHVLEQFNPEEMSHGTKRYRLRCKIEAAILGLKVKYYEKSAQHIYECHAEYNKDGGIYEEHGHWFSFFTEIHKRFEEMIDGMDEISQNMSTMQKVLPEDKSKQNKIADNLIREARDSQDVVKSMKMLKMAHDIKGKVFKDKEIPSKDLRVIHGLSGKKYLDEKLYEKAIEEFELTLKEYDKLKFIPSLEYDFYIQTVVGILECFNRRNMCDNSFHVAKSAIERIRPGDYHNQADLLFDLGQACTHIKRFPEAIEYIQQFQDSYKNLWKPETKFVVENMNLHQKLGISYMNVKEYEKAVEQFKEFQKLYEEQVDPEQDKKDIKDMSKRPLKLGEMFDKTQLNLLPISAFQKVEYVRSFAFMGTCFSMNNQPDKAMEALDTCLKSYWLENVNFKEGIDIDETQYLALIVMSVLSFNHNKVDFLKKYFKILLRPKPKFECISQGFYKCNANDIFVPMYFTCVNKHWAKLPYNSKKKTKKNWRLFKNTSLVNFIARRAFQA